MVMPMAPAVKVSSLALVTVPSAMGTAVPRSSKSLRWEQGDRCDFPQLFAKHLFSKRSLALFQGAQFQ
jgi:hypothetical protein